MASPVTHAIIGTAGHIDHGKTALIRALTGIGHRPPQGGKTARHLDRSGLRQLHLPDHASRRGRRARPRTFHPEHAGRCNGIDLVLFTIAADDGVMPQSEEHLDILHLLGCGRAEFS